MVQKLSRGPQVNVSKCQQIANGKYELVLIATCRAREIAKENSLKYSQSSNPDVHGPAVSALLEIQEGKVDCDNYIKTFITRNKRAASTYSGFNNRRRNNNT